MVVDEIKTFVTKCSRANSKCMKWRSSCILCTLVTICITELTNHLMFLTRKLTIVAFGVTLPFFSAEERYMQWKQTTITPWMYVFSTILFCQISTISQTKLCSLISKYYYYYYYLLPFMWRVVFFIFPSILIMSIICCTPSPCKDDELERQVSFTCLPLVKKIQCTV